MRQSRILLALALLMMIPAALRAAPTRYTLENGFIRLSGAGGKFDTFQIDPEGKSHYAPSWIQSLQIGDGSPATESPLRWELKDSTLRLQQIPIRLATSSEPNKEHSAPHRLEPGTRLGQRFRSPWTGFTRAAGFFPTWNSTQSGFTLTLRRDGPDGAVVARKPLRNIADNSEQSLEFAPQPPGLYYLEISDPIGTPGWWGPNKPDSPEETALVNGSPADFGLHLKLDGYEIGHADWTLTLDKSKLAWKITGTDAPATLITPWIKSGYVTSDPQRIVFTRFFTNGGAFRPVHQFKRKDTQDLGATEWIQMTGAGDFDLRFRFANGGGIHWRMSPDTMSYRFDRAEIEIAALPHTDALPDAFPVFFSSDPKIDAVLNQFYYSHALNFGIGCPPDWKEWQTKILCWTKNPQKDQQAAHLMTYAMRPDGYIYTWGGDEGWPFPYKDENKDGKNDYDTRHFTTNPCYILGCANHALWTRDRGFLETVLPRVRKAMEFELTQLHGDQGIILIDAKGHEGKADGIGSNYWDILPFGYKDAFCSSYYYAALEAMARMEEMAKQMGLPAGEHTPEYYRALRKKVRADYQANFWDERAGRFVGCVDTDGVKHDYGFTFVNLEAMAYGLADPDQVKRVYHWMETEPTSAGKADTYTRWIFAPRAATFQNPPRNQPQTPRPSWWHFGWAGTPFDDQCQTGGAILYTSYYDILARAKTLGADNAFARFKTILDRYAMPDHLAGGNPLFLGESSQGGGNGAGSVGVEGEFPESGLVPSSFLYAFLGIEPDADGLKIRPNLPSSLRFAGVKNLSYRGKTYEIRETPDTVTVRQTDPGSTFALRRTLKPGEVFLLDEYL